ncbi:hypothetical protein J4467_01230 [Candidatus Woesearchaeota archaeon]|nr:hypothetical protein [Candidatus Woesearchaeota archaeon]
MVKLVKRGDKYKPAKLKASIMRAGASSAIANAVVKSVKVKQGMTTLHLRKLVLAQLTKLSPSAAKKYRAHKKRR